MSEFTAQNLRFMREALAMAQTGVRRGEGGPFGAVIVRHNQIIGYGWNCVISQHDPTAHAEILAIRRACYHLHRPHLDDSVLYSTCEPCPMCLSAAYWARLDAVYYAATAADAAAIGFDDTLIYQQLSRPATERQLPLYPLLREEALQVFQQWQHSPLKQVY